MIANSVLEAPVVVPTDNGDHEKLSHIVVEGFWPKDEAGERTGQFLPETPVVDGVVFRTPVKALCGKVWVPDEVQPDRSVCPTCIEIAKEHGWKIPSQ